MLVQWETASEQSREFFAVVRMSWHWCHLHLHCPDGADMQLLSFADVCAQETTVFLHTKDVYLCVIGLT